KDNKAANPAKDTKESPIEEVSLNDDKDAEAKPPAQPPRPVDPLTQVTNDLKDAFPNIEDKLITAVLIASQGSVDPAFNALLYISDPSFKPEIPAPVVPSNKAAGKKSVAFSEHALTDDELLARKLQKEFELEDERRRRRHAEKKRNAQRGSQNQPQRNPDDSPDEFEQIKETFTQGLEEARTTLNSWVSGIAKKFDGNDDEYQEKPKQNTKLFGALGGSSFNSNNKRQNARFDEDPEILSHDFHNRISLTDNDKEELPALPNRNKEQSDKGTGAGPGSKPLPAVGKKWQPLNSDVPANSDAFLVTDSEDEDTGVANYNTKK
ncbi:uncharacterized protein CANTADRAFT_42018, partial [Suhomyces tanzawaensis NRRL Y-17324]